MPRCFSAARRSAAASGPRFAEVQPRDEVQEVLPRALAVALAEGGQLLAQDVVLGELLDERDELGLVLAGDAGDDVDQAVRVRADEVQRALGQPFDGQLGADRRPPAPGQPRVAGVAAAEHPHAQRQPPLADQPDPLAEPLAPGLAQAGPVGGAAAELAGALLRRDVRRVSCGRPAGGALPDPDLVPLDLEGHEGRHEVVDVGRAGQQHRERAGPAVVPVPAPGRRLGLLPGLNRNAVVAKLLGVLAHDDERRADDPVGEAADRVEEGAEVELLAGRERVQARAHRHVRRLEHAQLGLAARAQQRRVGALVKLDLVAESNLPVREAGEG